MSRISSLWVRNWSRLVKMRSAFFAVLWPTWLTEAIWLPVRSNTAYWFVTSKTFAF